MKLKKLGNTIQVKGKRVLIRIDANVPIEKGRTVDGPHGRIARAAVDINWLSHRGAKVIVMTHLGRPNGRRISAYSLKPIAKRLSGLLGARVRMARTVIGPDVKKTVETMADGEVLLLENLRFDAREQANDPSFAQELASIADLYVNDAFSVSHRAHASLDAITHELPSYAGPQLAQEVRVLGKLEQQAKDPFVLVLGGLKMSTKLPIIERFIDRIDYLVVGGALANVFFAAQGIEVGRSVYEAEMMDEAKRLMDTHGSKIVLPTDVVCVSALRKDARMQVRAVGALESKDRIVDIGPRTRDQFAQVISYAKTVVWNGPIGYCEIPVFCDGTRSVATAIANQTGAATTIVGGGDTLPVIESLRLADKFTLLSTGGGSLLQFLSGEPLPGIEALRTDV